MPGKFKLVVWFCPFFPAPPRPQDNGTIPFPEFLSKVHIPKNSPWTPTDEQRQRVKEAWEDGLRAEGTMKKQKTLRRKTTNPGGIDVSIISNT